MATAPKKSAKTAKPAATKKTAPQGVRLNPYLAFNGTCEAAFKFYRKVFGGEFCCIFRYKEMPPSEGKPDAKYRNKIMHIGLPVGSMVLMGSDGCPNNPVTAGDAVALFVGAPNPAEAKRIFRALSAKGKIVMPLERTFFAELFGVATDRFGVCWQVMFDGSGGK